MYIYKWIYLQSIYQIIKKINNYPYFLIHSKYKFLKIYFTQVNWMSDYEQNFN